MREVGGYLCHPRGLFEGDSIFQPNEDGYLVETPLEDLEGSKTKVGNHAFFVGNTRGGVERSHCGLQEHKILAGPINHKLLEPLGQSMAKKYK